jgi:large subunit ribosomal protein L15
MRMNNLKPAEGSRQDKKRVGRGIGSGNGKTCGRGHKGQTSRSGGYHKVGFEGGQMPLQRRLPKIGFVSRVSMRSAQIRLGELAQVDGDLVDIASLRACGLITASVKQAKIFMSGSIDRAVTVKGIGVSKGAKTAIEHAGGKVEE